METMLNKIQNAKIALCSDSTFEKNKETFDIIKYHKHLCYVCTQYYAL